MQEPNGNKTVGRIIIHLMEDGQIHVEGPQNIMMFCGMMELAKEAMLNSRKSKGLISVPKMNIPEAN